MGEADSASPIVLYTSHWTEYREAKNGLGNWSRWAGRKTPFESSVCKMNLYTGMDSQQT